MSGESIGHLLFGRITFHVLNLLVQVSGYSYETTDFETDYTATNLAQLTGGDSGGGDFIFNSFTHTWQLAGFNEAIDSSGDSYLVELSAYSSQITNIENGVTAVPEPNEWMLLLLGFLALFIGYKIKPRLQ